MTEAAARRAVTLEDVRRQRDEIIAIGQRHGVSNIRVFGSVARGEADTHSDLDLLVDVRRGTGVLTLSAFAGRVEELLGVQTQLATVEGLKPRIRDRVLAEAVRL